MPSTKKITLKEIRKYRIKNFKPHLDEINSFLCSCGGAAVKIITGIPLKDIHALHPSNNNWELEWMKSFLKLSGYNMIEVYHTFINQRQHWEKVFYRTNLMLMVVGITKRESTWVVYYNGKLYHAQNAFGKMESGDIFLNYPIERMFVLQKLR